MGGFLFEIGRGECKGKVEGICLGVWVVRDARDGKMVKEPMEGPVSGEKGGRGKGMDTMLVSLES